MATYHKPIKCCLCGTMTINRHNAQPVKAGQCCNSCNMTHVIPARMLMLTKERQIRSYVKEHGRTKARKHFSAELSNKANHLTNAVIEKFFSLPKSASDLS